MKGDDRIIPNVFISEEGEMIFVNEYIVTEEEQEQLLISERRVEKFETKYKTNDIWKAIEENATRKEIVNYIDARRHLMFYKRYGDHA